MTPEEIKNLRLARRETQTEFAEVIGTTQSRISKWETGYCKPTGLYLKALLDLKNVVDKNANNK